jgi:hypothetical protein
LHVVVQLHLRLRNKRITQFAKDFVLPRQLYPHHNYL